MEAIRRSLYLTMEQYRRIIVVKEDLKLGNYSPTSFTHVNLNTRDEIFHFSK